MGEDIDNLRKELRKELREIRELREELKEELEDVKRSKSKKKRIRHAIHASDDSITPCGQIDMSFLDGLEDMLDGIGEKICVAVEGIEDLPQMKKMKMLFKKNGHTSKDVSPDRISNVISPLGSYERLKILDFIKDGPKSFSEIETHIEKSGSSLTHHLNPLIDARYISKDENGAYTMTVEGSLAYSLTQWLTRKFERSREITECCNDEDDCGCNDY